MGSNKLLLDSDGKSITLSEDSLLTGNEQACDGLCVFESNDAP